MFLLWHRPRHQWSHYYDVLCLDPDILQRDGRAGGHGRRGDVDVDEGAGGDMGTWLINRSTDSGMRQRIRSSWFR
jgi:hypothetical protein